VNKQDNVSLTNDFDTIKKNGDEIVIDSNACFSKNYCKIPTTIRPNVAYYLNYYLEEFDVIFCIFLRNKDPQNLEEAQIVSIKLKGQFIAACSFFFIHDFQLLIIK
jgi:hypothetical protein